MSTGIKHSIDTKGWDILKVFRERQDLILCLFQEISDGIDNDIEEIIRKDLLFKIRHFLQKTQTDEEVIFFIDELLQLQEELLEILIKLWVKKRKNTRLITIYISPSDGGLPLLHKNYPLALNAVKRLHHNCGGPALLVFVDKERCDILGCKIIGRSNYYQGEGHYHYEPKELGEIILEDISNYTPNIIILMPNNATFFTDQFLEELKTVSGAYIVARFGDALSYDAEKVRKCLKIARKVDWFISDEREFVEIANKEHIKNVEYIPPFVNTHVYDYYNDQNGPDILFTGTGYEGLLMYGKEKMYVRRRRFIKKVDQIYGKRLLVVGKGWENLKLTNWKDSFISEEEVHQLAKKAKIVLAYDGPFTKGFTSGRTFRTLMSGAFLLIRYFPGIENLFLNRRHLVWFYSDEEGIA
ncbi:MAG: glycosyltransferase, partial [Candidatus Jordarchaeaceae archaeon]